MTPEAVLTELLKRMAVQYGEKIFITDLELSMWSSDAIVVMKSYGLITKAPPAISTLCPGCERECIMPVHVLTNNQDEAKAFIVCDKRSDINRVPLSSNQLELWQISVDSIAALLGGRPVSHLSRPPVPTHRALLKQWADDQTLLRWSFANA